MSASEVRVARVYDPSEPGDGARVLVDRLWPRGRRREDLAAEWLRDVAPSSGLRRWFAHRPERFDEFERRYRRELEAGAAADALDALVRRAQAGPITLLTATRATTVSQAEVLRRVIVERLSG